MRNPQDYKLLSARGVKYEDDDDDEEAQVEGEEKDSETLVVLKKLYEDPGRSSAERTCGSNLKLLAYYGYFQGSKLVAIWFWQFAFFYLDVALDISVFKVFAKNGDLHFIYVSVAGIILGTLYCLVEMVRGMGPPDPPWLLLVLGFLLLPQGHVFALCVYSTICLKGPHPMLLSFKLAESALEATVSSVIQTYSSIFRHLSAHDQAITYLSISSSYLSIAYAFTQFDHRAKGLHDLPGLCEHWLSPLPLVFLFRVCEVCSRIVSLGLLQRATRNEAIAPGYSLETYGCLVVIGLDFLIMFLLTVIYQCGRAGRGHWKNVQFSIISVVAYINPLLLKENAYTIPCVVYYSVRLLELLGMGALAYKTERLHCINQIHVWHTEAEPPAPICKKFQHGTFVGLQAFKEEFWDDDIPMIAFFISTLLMYILLPIIRCAFADNVLLRDASMFRTHQFGDTVDYLCKALLTGYGNGNLRRNPEGRQASDSAALRRRCRSVVDSARKALAKSIDELDLLHRTSSRNTGRKALASGDASNSLDGDGNLKKGGVMRPFEDWLDSEYTYHQKIKATQLSVGERFEQMVRVCWNVRIWLKIDADFDLFTFGKQLDLAETEQRERHRKCLEAMNVALLNPEVKERLLRPGVADMLLEMLPEFDKWQTRDKRILYQEMLLYREKCGLVGRILQKGWERDQDFLPVAQKLHRAVEIQTEALKKDAPEENKFVTRVKLNAYINMLQSIPSHQFRPDILSDKAGGLFRMEREFKNMVEAADAIMGYRKDTIIGVLDNKSEGQLDWTKKVELIRGAFDEKLEFEPQWEDVLDTSRAIGLLPQVVTIVRLEEVVFHKVDALPDHKPIKNMDELNAALKMAEEDRSKSGFYMQFCFRRVPEVEARPLSEIGSWEVHETLLLKFFKVISKQHRDRTILDLLADGDASDETKEAVAVLTRHRQALEDEVILTLNQNRLLLDAEGRDCVNPNTSAEPDIKTFRETFKKQLSHEELVTEVVVEEAEDTNNNKGVTKTRTVTVTEIKEGTQLRLAKYESLQDQMMKYLEKVKEEFTWSARVTEHIEKMIDGSQGAQEQDNSNEAEAGLKRQLERLRRDLFDYWQWVEERRARGAQRREAQAKTRELAAKEEELAAKREAARVEEEAKKKQDEAKRIEDEALKKEAQAKAEEAEAKVQAARAKEQEEKAKESEKSAKESEKNAIKRMEEAKQAEKKAKQAEEQAKLREKEANEKEAKAKTDMEDALEAKKKIQEEIADMRKQFEVEKKENKKEITERDKEIKKLQKAKDEAEGREKKLKDEVAKLKQG